ncbi:MAG: hypothetical protein LM517_10235 [Nitrosomonas sp.]|nr:hypothetical protein [Nitrosomonas sp.]
MITAKSYNRNYTVQGFKRESTQSLENEKVSLTKKQVSDLLKNLDPINTLTPTLRKLLEASLMLGTISSKILAQHLHCKPSIIREQFHSILILLTKKKKVV